MQRSSAFWTWLAFLGCVACGESERDSGTGGSAGASGGDIGHGGNPVLTGGGGGKESGGSGGQPSGGSPASGGGGQCADFAPSRYINASLLGVDAAYDGPVVVERSTADELVLVQLDDASSAATPTRAIFRNSGGQSATLPLIEPRTTLWLTRDEPTYTMQGGFASWVIGAAATLRNRESGALVLGVAYGPKLAGTSAAWPATVVSAHDTPFCTVKTDCYTDHHFTVNVQGDELVSVDPGKRQNVLIDGNSYAVRASRKSAVAVAGSGVCSDAVSLDSVLIDAVANEPAPLLAGLAVSELPACINGNDPHLYSGGYLSNVPSSTTYEGPVQFIARYPASFAAHLDSFRFTVPELETRSDLPAELVIDLTPGVFKAPAVGAELWATVDDDVIALRESSGGTLRLVLAHTSADNLERASARLSEVLETEVTLAESCVYGGAPGKEVALYEVELDGDAPARIPSGTQRTLRLGGNEFNVALDGLGAVSLVIHRRE